MIGGVDLCPCPLCGGNRGYALHDGGDHKRWNVVCIVCGEIVSECRRDGLVEAANTAWNEAGAYAAGLLADRDRLAAENAELHAEMDKKDSLLDDYWRAMDRASRERLRAMLAARPNPNESTPPDGGLETTDGR